MKSFRFAFSFVLVAGLSVASVSADVVLPSIFTSHLVLQRDIVNPVWGKADPGEVVVVKIGEQTHETRAGDDGRWSVKLDKLPAGGPHEITIQGKNKIVLEDCLVGEVWLCTGQSNMEWTVAAAFNPDLETMTADYPQIRLVTVPHNGVQEPQFDFKGEWKVCTPQTVGDFSAVGYFFGRQLHQALKVPVGLIDASWGGSACEAWINRETLTKDGRFSELIARWEEIEKSYDPEKAKEQYAAAMEKWKAEQAAAKEAGKPFTTRQPAAPGSQLSGNARPGNIYNGSLKPIMGYGIKGNIWYQGESNANRAYQYRDLFPLMISTWRDEWAEGDFPFYWVQLADYLAEQEKPGDSAWAELREAQSMTMKLPKTGEAVIIDLGESNDIHPRNKLEVAMRLARWALANEYDKQIAYKNPRFKEMDVVDHRVQLTFDDVGGNLKAYDYHDIRGFAVAGEDKVWHWAKATLNGPNKVLVSSDEVKKPVAVRYGWADNPVCNLHSTNGLPVAPFRTDDWPGVTIEAK